MFGYSRDNSVSLWFENTTIEMSAQGLGCYIQFAGQIVNLEVTHFEVDTYGRPEPELVAR